MPLQPSCVRSINGCSGIILFYAGKLQNYLAASVFAYYQKRLLFRFKPLHGRSQAMLSKILGHIPEGIWFLVSVFCPKGFRYTGGFIGTDSLQSSMGMGHTPILRQARPAEFNIAFFRGISVEVIRKLMRPELRSLKVCGVLIGGLPSSVRSAPLGSLSI